jgi:bacteriocin-like protein
VTHGEQPKGSLKMPNLDQTKHIDFIRELTLNELQAVSGGGDDSGDDLGGDFDGGGPVPGPCVPGKPC